MRLSGQANGKTDKEGEKMKLREYRTESHSETRFWNDMINMLSRKYGKNLMLRERKNGTHAVLPINSFYPLPKELLDVAGKLKTIGPNSKVTDKEIALTFEEWQEVMSWRL
jgi:hypothetical protein